MLFHMLGFQKVFIELQPSACSNVTVMGRKDGNSQI